MAGVNGNLSLEERRGLRPGAVVTWRGRRMLSDQTGTVEAVGGSGRLQLSDGSQVWEEDYCGLVSGQEQSAAGAVAGDCPRGSEDLEGADGPQGSAEAPASAPVPATGTLRVCRGCGGVLPAEAGSQAKLCPGCRAAGKRRNLAKARPATYDEATVERHLAACKRVRELMEAGQPKARAVAAVAAEMPGLITTAAKYGWWHRRLVRDGLLAKGPKLMPTKAARLGAAAAKGDTRTDTDGHGRGSAIPAGHQVAIGAMEDLAQQLTAAKAERDEARQQLGSLKEAYAKLQEEAAGPASDDLLDRGRRLFRRLAVALAVARIEEDARQDLRAIVGACEATRD